MTQYQHLIHRRAVRKGEPGRICTVSEVYPHQVSRIMYVRLMPDAGPMFAVRLDTFKADWTLLAQVIPFRASVVSLSEYRAKRESSASGGSAYQPDGAA